MPDNRKIFLFAAVSIILLRWVFPEADPPWFKDLGDFHDETWWAENARRKILFNTWFWDQFAGALAAGPLSALWHYLTFKVFGISFFSLRLIALVPATLTGLILLKSSHFHTQKQGWIILLILTSAGWFAYSRIGYIESMLLFIFISTIALFKIGSKSGSVAGVILLCGGMLFKGSFIYLALPLLVWSAFQPGLTIKHKTSRLIGFGALSIFFWLIYYYPHQELFLPYSAQIKAQFYSTSQLLHPGGWLARLIWLPSKETFSAPFTGWILILLLTKWVKNGIASLQNSFSFLLILCVLFALPSDFSDRRLVFFFILPALCLGETDVIRKKSFSGSFILNFFMLLPILQAISERALRPDDLLSYYLLPAIILASVLFLLMKLESHYASNLAISPLSLVALAISAHSLIFHSSARWADALGVSFQLLYYVQLILFIGLVGGFIVKAHIPQKGIVAGITILQLAVCIQLLLSSTFTVQKTASGLAKEFKAPLKVQANPAALELLFLSQARNAMYPEELRNIDATAGVYLFTTDYVLTRQDSINIFQSSVAQMQGIVPSGKGHRLKYIFTRP